jgi:hypothetical protein
LESELSGETYLPADCFGGLASTVKAQLNMVV